MNMKTKMLAGATLLAAIPVIVSSLLINSMAFEGSREALAKTAEAQLTAIRGSTKSHIEDKFRGYRNQVITFSNDRMVIDAMRAFSYDFDNYLDQTTSNINSKGQDLANYYQQDFFNEFQTRNPNSSLNVESAYRDLPPEAIAFQHRFIKANPNPLGAKDELIDPADGSTYARTHKLYHPIIRQYLQKFEYYDIFLIDHRTGNIVYSVFKELDFATSLLSGPYANSGLAKAFKEANASSDRNFAYLTDFSPYQPSYNDPAAFIGSPIYDGDEKVGVLVFQMPIDQINFIMTQEEQWQTRGLGESGETYLVGDDLKMRSQSRFLMQDPEGYETALSAANMPADLVKTITTKGTSIGLQPADSQGSRAALDGKTGFAVFEDYRNVPVLSAYAPLDIEGVNWAIMSEIDEEEAYQGATALADQLNLITLGVIAVVATLATVIGFFFANWMVQPILALADTLKGIEKNTDLTLRCDNDSNDETGQAASALNSMMESFSNAMRTLRSSVDTVAQSSQETLQATQASSESIRTGRAEVELVATAMTEMTSTIEDISSNTTSAAHQANDAMSATEQCQKMMEQSISSLEALSQQVDTSAKVIQDLENDSDSVTQVLDVIRNVAEQTNLLALNAAIEAARAGEQGRGFAVVADEVRTLAQRTQESTSEIQSLIENFQEGAAKAVTVMQRSREDSTRSVELSINTGESLQNIVDITNQINDVMLSVASATEEQTAVAAEIQNNMLRINGLFDDTDVAMQQTTQASMQMNDVAAELKGISHQFKT